MLQPHDRASEAESGLEAVSIDADDDPLLARFVDPSGAVVARQLTAPDLAWIAQHGRAWDPARLDELIRAAVPATLYVCGGADNQQDIADRFTQVFLLLQDHLGSSGAIVIDARLSLDQVVDAILCRTLPVPPRSRPL